MDFDLSPDHELIRSTVREFAEGEVAPVAEELDRCKAFPYEIVAQLGKLNLMGIPFPEEYGGGGGDSLAYALAVEELARVDSSVAITLCAHTSLGTQPIYLFGSEEQKREWMPQLCSGEKLGAFGLTEPEAGSDAGNTRTRARLQDGEWAIDGAKQFITNAGTEISGVVCITAVTGESDDAGGANGGESGAGGKSGGETDPAHPGAGNAGASKEISNIIVPNGTPGYEQGEPYRKMGWNASDTRPLSFADCRVPRGEPAGPPRAGLQAVPARARHRAHRRGGDGRGPRAGSARRGAQVRQGAQGVRQADLEVPGDSGQAGGHVNRDRRRPPARAQGGAREGRRGATSRSPPLRPSSRRAAWRCAAPRRRCRSTAGMASSRSTPCAASTATRRSSRSGRAPTRCSRW